MAKYIKLSAQEKENIRRLTQLANRRIRSAMKTFEEQGLTIAPKEVTGGIQTRKQWHTDKNPISRKVTFETQEEYKKQLRFLKQFDPKEVSYPRPTIKEYDVIQKKKVTRAIETVTEGALTQDLKRKIDKLDSAELSKFWEGFAEVGSKLGLEFSSDSALTDYAREYFKEDVLKMVDPDDE